MQQNMAVEHVVALLDGVPLFSSLSEEYKKLLADRLGYTTFEAGQVIVEHGDEGDRMYIVVKGKVGVFQVDEMLELEVELARLYPGQFFGEMSLITGAPRSAMCKALVDTEALVLHQQTLFALMQRMPEISIAMCRVLATRLSEADQRTGKPRLDPSKLVYDEAVYTLLPDRLLHLHKLIPLSYKRGVLTIATPEPDNLLALDDIRRVVRGGAKIRTVFITPEGYDAFLAEHVSPTRQGLAGGEGIDLEEALTMVAARNTVEIATGAKGGGVLADDIDMRRVHLSYSMRRQVEEEETDEDPVAFFDRIVVKALRSGASDIHIEPTPYSVVVRYRIEGRLVLDPDPVPIALGRAIVSRIKVLAGLDISERRKSQDGRISMALDGRPYDLRLNTMPTIDGEKAVLRVLDTIAGLKPLDEIVLIEPVCKLMKRAAHQPYGMIIVCGPTGSGKTTTLYSALHERADDDTNITTVEDPVEYNIPSFNQIQVNNAAGLTFPAVLRGILRQNPDVILVGETRDIGTAKIAVEAGLIGHLVMTSFHASTASGALVRLMEMGMDPYSLGYAINAILCQRLIRRLCSICTEERAASPQVIGALVEGGVLPEGTTEGRFMHPKGCPKCHNSGFSGRVATFEFLVMSENIRSQLLARAPLEEITRAARGGEYVSMAKYGAYLLSRGLTTPEEVLRTTHLGAIR